MNSLRDDFNAFFRDHPTVLPFHLAKAAGVDPGLITAVRKGRKAGCSDRTYRKLLPYFKGEKTVPPSTSATPGQVLPCDPAPSHAPGQGEGDAA